MQCTKRGGCFSIINSSCCQLCVSNLNKSSEKNYFWLLWGGLPQYESKVTWLSFVVRNTGHPDVWGQQTMWPKLTSALNRKEETNSKPGIQIVFSISTKLIRKLSFLINARCCSTRPQEQCQVIKFWIAKNWPKLKPMRNTLLTVF